MAKPRKRGVTHRMQFTEGRVASLAARDRPFSTYDDKVKSLGVKVLPSGRKVYFWFRSVPLENQPETPGKPTWKSIGEAPALPLADARTCAQEYDTMLARWKASGCPHPSPFKVKDTGELTLGQLAEDFFARHVRTHATRPEVAERQDRYKLDTHLAEWKTRRLSTITRKDVQQLHEHVGKNAGPCAANAVVGFVGRLFNFAIKTEQFTSVNPAAHVEKFHEEKRKRFLQRDELPKLFAALATEENQDLVDFVNLALWTGARKSDVLSMRWADLALDDNRWNVPYPKGGESYTVALTAEAVEILKKRKNAQTGYAASPWVFPGAGKTGHLVDLQNCWTELLKRAGIADFHIHDLRRTLASWQAMQGTSLLVIGKSLGHRSVSATAIYSQLSLAPVREAVTQATRAMIAAAKQ
jgi:integrase